VTENVARNGHLEKLARFAFSVVESARGMKEVGVRFPITLYKEELSKKNQFAEYHEVSYARDSKSGGFALLDSHGWWEHEKEKPFENRRILYEPQKTEQDASDAMDKRVAWLLRTVGNINMCRTSMPRQALGTR
jgi:hypothetical protein